MASVAHYDNRAKSRRTATGMTALLDAGRWTFKAPLGYLNTGARVTPSLIPDPERADFIRLAFRLVAEGTSPIEVARRITAGGFRTRSGSLIALQTFVALLRNPLYSGRVIVKSWNIDRPGDFEPLVEETVFRRVQKRLERRSSDPRGYARDRPDFALRRLLTCSTCQRPVTGSWSKGRVERYGYYHCPRCRGIRGRRERVEAGFVTHLERLQPKPSYMRLFRAIVLDAWEARTEHSKENVVVLERKASELHARLEALEDAFIYKRVIDKLTYEPRRDRLREQIQAIELQLAEDDSSATDVNAVLEFAERVLTNAAGLWAKGDLAQRRQIQHAIFPEGLPFDGREFGTAVTCLAFSGLAPSKVGGNRLASRAGFEPAIFALKGRRVGPATPTGPV